MRKCISEALGTFCLVFAGTGAIIINDVSGGTVSHAGIALTFGLVVMAMIYTFGDISGAPPARFDEVRDLIEAKVKQALRAISQARLP